METSNADAIIDFCLAPLSLSDRTEAEREVRRRLQHVLRTFQARIPQPVAVDGRVARRAGWGGPGAERRPISRALPTRLRPPASDTLP